MRLLTILLFTAIVFLSLNRAFANDKIDANEAFAKVKGGALLVDVRSPEEFASGHIKGAINIQHDQVTERLSEFGNDKNKEIVLYCRSGRRSGIAQEALTKAGFVHVYNGGGFSDLEPTFAK